MKVIVVSGKHGQSRSLFLGRWTRALLSMCLLGGPLVVGACIGYSVSGDGGVLGQQMMSALMDQSSKQKLDLIQTKEHTLQQLEALTLKVAQLQARLVRLDALGERITTIAKLDKGEFDFSQLPALGGPQTADLGSSFRDPDFIEMIDQLVERVDNREQQLGILEALLANRKIQDEVFLAGRPVTKGWMSSRYGRRTDPFTGRVAMHGGVDFAGKEGTDIIAVASGVVTWSSERHGYGDMVQINHGSGYMTRYAHNKENKVKVGDIVKKGQVIALMGSSGRSTGPHVHFEVYKHGRPVDPATYIHRASR